MKRILHKVAKSITGVPGVSYFETASLRRDGTRKRFFSVFFHRPDGRRANRRFCIDTLGKPEALRRALRCRAEYETRVMALRSQVSGLRFQEALL